MNARGRDDQVIPYLLEQIPFMFRIFFFTRILSHPLRNLYTFFKFRLLHVIFYLLNNFYPEILITVGKSKFYTFYISILTMFQIFYIFTLFIYIERYLLLYNWVFVLFFSFILNLIGFDFIYSVLSSIFVEINRHESYCHMISPSSYGL